MNFEDWWGVLISWVGGLLTIIWAIQFLVDPSRVREGTLAYRWMKLPNRPLTPRAVRLWAITWVIGALLLMAASILFATGIWP